MLYGHVQIFQYLSDCQKRQIHSQEEESKVIHDVKKRKTSNF